MSILFWICQAVAGAMFIMAGVMKSTQPKEKLAPKMPWVNDYSAGSVKMVGISELLGGIGLIVPWATGILPILTPVAAAALGLIMILAAIYHFRRNEMKAVVFNIVLFLILALVVYGRGMAVSV